MPTYPLHDIFHSLQGEGRNTGKPVTFIRFSGCNLACPWCDTDHTTALQLTLADLFQRVQAHPGASVILTGGEPLIQPDLFPLVAALKAAGFWIGIETNGTREPTPSLRAALDYIAASPKVGAPLNLRSAHEVRLVVTNDITPAWCADIRKHLPAQDYYLSPCDEGGHLNMRATIHLLGQLNASAPTPPWRLSIQTHKLAGIP